MSDDRISVKVNRSEGSVEITGGDKEWIAEQLTKLAVVYETEPQGQSADEGADPQDSEDNAEHQQKPRRKRRKTSSPSGSGSGGSSAEALMNEKLDAATQGKLEGFVAPRRVAGHFKTTHDQAAIIAFFLEEVLKFDGISSAELASVYRIMGWREPGNPRAVINNARNRQHYFRGWANGRTKLSASGRNFANHDSLNARNES